MVLFGVFLSIFTLGGLASLLLSLRELYGVRRIAPLALERIAQATAVRRLRWHKNGGEVQVSQLSPLQGDERFHLFLSHAWGTGQDQMRIVKTRFREMIPGASIFLDVDDMLEGNGASYVALSHTVLIFMSSGYLASLNCMRELVFATHLGKPLVVMHELDHRHGGQHLDDIAEKLHVTTTKLFANLAPEMDAWGYSAPTAAELHRALFTSAVEPLVEWNRIGVFQDVTMRLIAERLLPTEQRGSTFVQGEASATPLPVLPPPDAPHRYHIFCSEHNLGGLALLTEVSDACGLPLAVTTQASELPACQHMLLYLTTDTWRSATPADAERSAALAADVRRALELKTHLLLAHELPGLDPPGARAAEHFDSFFASADGATPPELLQHGIYAEIAVALKCGEWRRTSLVLLARSLLGNAKHELQGARAANEQGTRAGHERAHKYVDEPNAHLGPDLRGLMTRSLGALQALRARNAPSKASATGSVTSTTVGMIWHGRGASGCAAQGL